MEGFMWSNDGKWSCVLGAGFAAADQAGLPKISAFFAVIGRNMAFPHDLERKDVRPRCQSQRGRAEGRKGGLLVPG